MSRNVAIVGIGYTSFRPLSPEVSYKEIMYEAAVKAYEDAGIDPRAFRAWPGCPHMGWRGTATGGDECAPSAKRSGALRPSRCGRPLCHARSFMPR